ERRLELGVLGAELASLHEVPRLRHVLELLRELPELELHRGDPCLERADALDLADARGGPARGRPGPCRPGRTSDRLRRLLRSRSRWRGPRAPTRAERGRIGVGE